MEDWRTHPGSGQEGVHFKTKEERTHIAGWQDNAYIPGPGMKEHIVLQKQNILLQSNMRRREHTVQAPVSLYIQFRFLLPIIREYFCSTNMRTAQEDFLVKNHLSVFATLTLIPALQCTAVNSFGACENPLVMVQLAAYLQISYHRSYTNR